MTDSLQFTIREEGGKFCLYTKDGSRKLGCHDSREDAEKQEAAIESRKTEAAEAEIAIAQYFETDYDDKGPSRTFLNNLRRRLMELFNKSGKISRDDFDMCARKARAAAGGTMKSRKRKRTDEPWFDGDDLCDLAASSFDEGDYGPGEATLLHTLKFASVEDGQWIPYLPVPGDYESPRYGTIIITRERNQRFVDNFKGGIYQKTLPVDAEHETKLSGAMAWVVDMRQNMDGSVDAQVNWTDRGREMMANDRFKFFSPEFFDQWADPSTGTVHRDIAAGGALTTRPFFKEKVLRPLVASETGIDAYEDEETHAHFERKQEDSMSEKEKQAKAEEEKKAAEAKAAKEKEEAEKKAAEKKEAEAKAAAEKKAKEEREAKTAAERIQAVEEENKRLKEDAVKAAEKVLKLESDARRKRFSDIVEGKTETSKHRWFGEADKNVDRLESLAVKLGEDSDEFKSIVSREIASANQIASGKLFEARGYDGPSHEPESAAGKIAAEAKKLMSEDPDKYPSIEKARVAARAMNPSLRDQEFAESQRRG